jgi:chromosome segregation ATPase
LSIRQEEHAQALRELERQIVAVQESVGVVSGQLRERTVSLAAESQANIGSLAARLQEHLDAIATDQESTLAALATEQESNLAALASKQESTLAALAIEQQARLDAFAAEWQTRLELLTKSNNDPSPELILHGEQIAELSRTHQDWQSRLAKQEEQIAELASMQQSWWTRLAQSEEAFQAVLSDRLPVMETEMRGLREEASALSSHLTQQQAVMGTMQASIGELDHVREIMPVLDRLEQEQMRLAQQEEQIAELARVQQEWQSQLAQMEQTQQAMMGEQASAVEAQIAALREQSGSLASHLNGQQTAVAALEENISKLGHIREIMPILDRLEQELELRQAEEVRLSNLIATQESRLAPLAAALEDASETSNALLSRVSESERLLEELRGSIQDFNDNWKPALSEASRRITPLAERITVLSNNVMKAEAGLQALSGDQSELREMMVGLTDDVRRNQGDVSRQLEGWQATLDENKDTIERFTQQWLTLSNQYKEARMAVQNFAHWQKQLEQQKREASEMLRIESNRMQSRWDGFLLEIQEKLKNFELELGQKWQAFELENEQKWSSARRNEQLRREELAAVDELIQKLQQDNRNLIWRVQAAQADAIKKWPRLLMEEVEKAVELNPNRRLTSTGAAPRTEMSVVDAIEQGLITIDYNDDSALDL